MQRYRLAGEIELYNPPGVRALESLADPTGTSTRPNVVFTLFRTVELYLRALQLLPYARREAEAIPLPIFDEEKIDAALFQLGVFGALDPKERMRIQDAVTSSA